MCSWRQRCSDSTLVWLGLRAHSARQDAGQAPLVPACGDRGTLCSHSRSEPGLFELLLPSTSPCSSLLRASELGTAGAAAPEFTGAPRESPPAAGLSSGVWISLSSLPTEPSPGTQVVMWESFWFLYDRWGLGAL